MRHFLTLFLLAGAVSATQAQKLQKTALQIPNLKIVATFKGNYGSIYGFGSDEGNYYMYNSNSQSFYVINKKLSTTKECPIKENKEDYFLRILTTESDVIVLVARSKKGEQKTHIIKQVYAKSTGKFKQETVIASFTKSKSESWYFYSSVSPDKTKTAFLFMIASKKNTVDSYYAAILGDECNIEWSSENELGISNETFSVQDFTLTNKGELYIAFLSKPEKVKKATDKNLYVDLVYLSDDAKEKMQIPIEKYQVGEIRLKPLKNGDVYLAALFAEDDKSYQKELFSLRVNGKNFNEDKSHKKEINETNTHIRLPASYFIPGKFLSNLGIERILELDNGNIAVVCEQATAIVYGSTVYQNGVANTAHAGSMTVYVKVRGSVSTFFVNGNDASVENVSVMEKLQLNRSQLDYPAKSFNLSIFPFAYENKVGYIFNDCLTKYSTPAKYKGISFKNIDGKDVAIVLSTQENGEKAKITTLSGSVAAGRLLRQVLFEEEDRLIILTQNKKAAYIETLSLP